MKRFNGSLHASGSRPKRREPPRDPAWLHEDHQASAGTRPMTIIDPKTGERGEMSSSSRDHDHAASGAVPSGRPAPLPPSRSRPPTPGPWRVDENWAVRCPARGFEDDREFDGKVCDVGYLPNAHLIAAAPELLAFAKLIERSSVAEHFRNEASAIVAKATGHD